MKSSWEYKRLIDLGTFSRGISKHRPRNDQILFTNGKYPFVQTSDVKKANLYIKSNSEFYNEVGLSQSKLWPKGTLCITIAANIAETGILAYPMCFPDSIVGFTANEKFSSELFMYYVFEYLKQQIQNQASGSIQDNINIEYLTNLKIRIPDKKSQDTISDLLSTLDTKIINNNAIAQQLEAMVKTIYDYWFLQFEFPNEEGKPYKSSGGKMVWNEELQREIPAGWSIKNMGDFIDVVRGVSYSPKDVLEKPSKNSVSLLKSNNIQDNTINLDSSIYLDRSKIKENQYLDKGSVFITMSSGSKAHMGKTAIIYKSIKYTYGAFCAKIIVDRDYNAMISLFFTSSYFRKYIEQVTSGTSINNISVNHLQAIKIPVPPIEVSQKFNEIVEPFYDELGNVFEQNQKLQSLRDFLLPLLMNGQVSVKTSE